MTAVDNSGNESARVADGERQHEPGAAGRLADRAPRASSCPVVVGDITGDGAKEIVAGNEHLYAWTANGIELRDDDSDPETWGVFVDEIKTVTGAPALGELIPQRVGFEVFAWSWDDTNRHSSVRGDGAILSGWPRNPDPNHGTEGVLGERRRGRCGRRRARLKSSRRRRTATSMRGTRTARRSVGHRRSRPASARTRVRHRRSRTWTTIRTRDRLWSAQRHVPRVEHGRVESGAVPEGTRHRVPREHRDRRRQRGRGARRRDHHRGRRDQRSKHEDRRRSCRDGRGAAVQQQQPEVAVAGTRRLRLRRLPRDRRGRQRRRPGTARCASTTIRRVQPGWPMFVGGNTSESSPIVADVSGDGIA